MTKRKGMLITALALLTVSLSMPAMAKSRASVNVKGDHTSSYGPQAKRFGAGLYLGEPMGLTMKGYVSERVAIDGVAGWTFHDRAFTIMSDVTYDFFDIPVDSNDITLPLYFGLGGKLEFGAGPSDDTIFGLRVPIGLAVQWTNHPVEFFAEVAPGVELTPDADFDVTGGVGVRFYFF